MAKSLKVLNTCLELWAGACEVWSFLLCQGLCNLLVKVMTVLLEKAVMFVYYPQENVKVGGCYMSELNVPCWCEVAFAVFFSASNSFVFSEVTFDVL